ncbi:Retrovirus-related Pol polyprotein from transposon 17.6 [Nosema granulosis]|uniref:Retrovirus-related Pol polyprotein from transposon 17.6 n=1 Tax=Nosema granulosis TaxID=83296 RepID=A0A9P6KYB9_9MICR|nr:Retrovirus-related Pol polyprotein from transposon 17.6 [Nosema granulosis]
MLGAISKSCIILNKKSKFIQKEVKLLGNIISEVQVKPDPNKVECIKKYSLPKNVKELISFLGLINYSRDITPNFAQIALPLNNMLKGEPTRSMKTQKRTKNTIEGFRVLKPCFFR